MNEHEQHFDAERAAMVALSYLGLALFVVVAVAAATLMADHWTDLTWARDVLQAVVDALR